MSIPLPESIADYFRTTAEKKPHEAAAAFTPGATIVDEGEDLEIAGRDAIHRWFTELDAKYENVLKVTDLVERDGEAVVTTLVSGNFPGSPAEFVYRFTLGDGLIDRLVIEFVGFK